MTGIPQWMFEETKARVYGMAIGSYSHDRNITSIYVPIVGIKGSGDTKTKVTYQLFIDLDKFYIGIPDVFVLRPEDKDIRHVNIYPAGKFYCHKLKRALPALCHGKYEETWKSYGDKKHLLMFFNHIQDLLNHENFQSPARPRMR